MGHTGTNMLQVATVPIISKQLLTITFIEKFNICIFFASATFDCIRWHESKRINVELYSEMFCAGHSDGHQDACLGKLEQLNEKGRHIKVEKGCHTVLDW